MSRHEGEGDVILPQETHGFGEGGGRKGLKVILSQEALLFLGGDACDMIRESIRRNNIMFAWQRVMS